MLILDIEILRTFQEVAQTRHFAKAADNLFVTQAAVSARISQLESRLGVRLFTRQRNNIQLTSEGHRLLAYAEAITGSWNRAMAEIGGSEDTQLVALGCLPSIGEIFLDHLLQGFHRVANETLVQIEQLNSATLVARVRDQSLHIGLLYEPPRTKDLIAEHIADIELVLVSSTPGLSIKDKLDNYLYVDWGTSFSIAHNAQFATTPKFVTRVDTPRPALNFMLQQGGTAYLAHRQVSEALCEGRLHSVMDAPVINRSVYLIYSNAYSEDEKLGTVIRTIRSCVGI